MRNSKYVDLLNRLLRQPIFTACEARNQGIPSRMLTYFCKQGKIERVKRGLYRSLDVSSNIGIDFEEMVLMASTIPRGVICLISALCYYNLTDQIMREYWIAVPNVDRSPRRPYVRIIRMRNMTLGQTTVKIGKYKMKIFDRERTVVDAFRLLSHEIAIKALQRYLKDFKETQPDLHKLSKYAAILRVSIEPYILALTT